MNVNENSDVSSFCDTRSREIPLFATALWIGSYLAALLAQKYLVLTPALHVVIALLPVAPFAFFVHRFIAHLRSLDELHRRVHFEALAFAFPLAILLLMTLGLLERTHLLLPKDWTYRHVWYYLPFFYFIGLAVAWRRYR